ncbi:U3 small nucleolar RNA-associated protein 11 [Cryptosporidium ryanae]|uniref:U3 small nucleolar RNA-associated protein 11 n=1 Tax=Cryptosporidium ryanae TaxID=515981 RepID=UPI003519E068|nr:U3 small nucleolar RNA-associated protein 11 [Cryptosporidium ryanae]
MEKELTLFGESFERNHTFFSEDDESEDNRYTDETDNNKLEEYLSNGIVKSLTKSYRIMNDTKVRADSLRKISNHLEMQKNMQSSERKRKIVHSNGKTEVIWHPKRKK